MNRRIIIPLFAFFVSSLLLSHARAVDTAVRVWEENIVIPTYLVGPPDPNPQFYFGGASQGAEHRIYPYPAYDNLLNQKVDKTYKMVYLENEYIKVGILPEIGGKIFEAIDKTNGYNFFYRQHVIKPALISLLGAWISGGVEWDVPHHHRATSFLPVQYKTEENADGSKTIWVGELELRDRMRWAVGVTLHPGKSYLEASFRMINRTPVPTSMLCFSNVAVHVNENYQVLFPPSTQHVTYHAKREFATWPIATSFFSGADFTAGVDVSWVKNHYNSMSMFAWNYTDDFFAGYDHGRHAGTMSIADHNVVPGKKFFTWGNGPRGKMEDKLLTEDDGSYIELMVGAYSDNQPDYTWLAPYESRMWTQYWYPFRDIDGVKYANTEAAINLDVKDGKARVGFFTTSAYPNANLTLKLKDQVLLQENVAIDPGKPFVKDGIALPSGADEHDLRAAISVDGKELASYSPVRLTSEPMPQPYNPPPSPDQIKTNEELLLAGLRIDAFHNPQLKAEPYWEEALKRDPGDARVNTALAINYIKKARYADAEKLLRAAIERITFNYTTPKDGEPFYYLGLALKAQGKNDEAFTSFFKSTWTGAFRSPAYFELAQVALTRNDRSAALNYLDRALAADANNIRAIELKGLVNVLAGHPEQAGALAAAAARIDPLDAEVIDLQYMASQTDSNRQRIIDTLLQNPQLRLEMAAECLNIGQWKEGIAFLDAYVQGVPDKTSISPLVYYDMAYMSMRAGQDGQAGGYLAKAMAQSPDYVFPFQRELIDVLEFAIKANPSDSRAPYYLGNLLYDWQPDRAVQLWEKSVSLGADFPVVYRNLATVYTRNGSRDKALAMLEKAVQFGGNAKVFNDLDQLYQENAVSPDKRLSLMEQHQKLIDRDDVISREIDLKIFAGKYDDALALLNARFFHAWEGGGRFNVGESWTNAMIGRGQQKLAAKQIKEALADFQAATTLPQNLIEANNSGAARAAEVDYFIGLAYEGMGDQAKAKEAWNKSIAGNAEAAAGDGRRGFGGGRGGRGFGGRGGGALGGGGTRVSIPEAMPYYQAMAWIKLGQPEKAQPLFQQLANTSLPANDTAAQRVRQADAHYLVGLGRLGLNDKEKAKREFDLALQAAPDHLGAKQGLGMAQ